MGRYLPEQSPRTRRSPWKSPATGLGNYATTPGVQTLVDGQPMTLSTMAHVLPGGGSITDDPSASQETVSWPDGSFVVADYSGGYYLTLEVSASKAQQGHLSGLLGNDDGNAADDIATRAGVAVPYPPTTQELYAVF